MRAYRASWSSQSPNRCRSAQSPPVTTFSRSRPPDIRWKVAPSCATAVGVIAEGRRATMNRSRSVAPIRAAVAIHGSSHQVPVGVSTLSKKAVIAQLRRAGLVRSQRGCEGGYWLSRPAGEITVGDVVRAVDGPFPAMHGEPVSNPAFAGQALALDQLWRAAAASLERVVDLVTVADLAAGRLPAEFSASIPVGAQG